MGIPEGAVPEPATLYEAVGGEPTFQRLVHDFYSGVAGDPELRAIYPEQDLSGAEDRLRMFLIQYWGGPRTYSDQRGHPRLRMRHAGYHVGPRARDAWLRHMRSAVEHLDLPDDTEDLLWDYLLMAAASMVNSVDGDDGASSGDGVEGAVSPETSGPGLTIEPGARGEAGSG